MSGPLEPGPGPGTAAELPAEPPGEPPAELEARVFELARRVGLLLEPYGAVITPVESCTGGLVARALTESAGSSAWFDQGFVTYSNTAKQDLVGVSGQALAEHGAVSEAVAREMALGGLRATCRPRQGQMGTGTRVGVPAATAGSAVALRAGSPRIGCLSLAITGIAGPTGAVPGKPVGTVCFAWALLGPQSTEPIVRAQTARFEGDRASIRLQAALWALEGAERLWRREMQDRPPLA